MLQTETECTAWGHQLQPASFYVQSLHTNTHTPWISYWNQKYLPSHELQGSVRINQSHLSSCWRVSWRVNNTVKINVTGCIKGVIILLKRGLTWQLWLDCTFKTPVSPYGSDSISADPTITNSLPVKNQLNHGALEKLICHGRSTGLSDKAGQGGITPASPNQCCYSHLSWCYLRQRYITWGSDGPGHAWMYGADSRAGRHCSRLINEEPDPVFNAFNVGRWRGRHTGETQQCPRLMKSPAALLVLLRCSEIKTQTYHENHTFSLLYCVIPALFTNEQGTFGIRDVSHFVNLLLKHHTVFKLDPCKHVFLSEEMGHTQRQALCSDPAFPLNGREN